MGTILPYTIHFENGQHGPAWTWEGAGEMARQIEGGRHTVIRITQGKVTVAEGEALQQAMRG